MSIGRSTFLHSLKPKLNAACVPVGQRPKDKNGTSKAEIWLCPRCPRKLCGFFVLYTSHCRLRTRWHQWYPFKPRWLQLSTETQHSDSEGQQVGVLEINHLQNKNEGMDFYIMSWAKKKSGSVFFFLVFSDLMLKVHYVLKSWGVGEDWLTDSFCLTKQNKQTLCFLKEQHNFTLFDALFTFGGPGHLSSFKQYSGDLISLWEQLVCSVWK